MCVLRALIGMSFRRPEAAGLLRDLEDVDPGALRESAVVDRLVHIARRQGCAARRLEGFLGRRLRKECARYEGCTLAQLAQIWAGDGRSLDGRALAALLWTVARNDHPAFRKLEDRLARDIELLAFQALADSAPARAASQQSL